METGWAPATMDINSSKNIPQQNLQLALWHPAPVYRHGYCKLFSRAGLKPGKSNEVFGKRKEWLIVYCKEVLQQTFYDYFIFGHRHLPIDFKLMTGEKAGM